MDNQWNRPTSFAPRLTNSRHLAVVNYKRPTAREQTDQSGSSWRLFVYILTGSAIVLVVIVVLFLAIFVRAAETPLDDVTYVVTNADVFAPQSQSQQKSSASIELSTTVDYDEMKPTTTMDIEDITSSSSSTSDNPLSRRTTEVIMTSTDNVIEHSIMASSTTSNTIATTTIVPTVDVDQEQRSTIISHTSTTPEVQTSSTTVLTTTPNYSQIPNVNDITVDNTGWSPLSDDAFYMWLASGFVSKENPMNSNADDFQSTSWKPIDDPETMDKRTYIGAEVLSRTNNAATYDNIRLADDILSGFTETTTVSTSSGLEGIARTPQPVQSDNLSLVVDTADVSSTFNVPSVAIEGHQLSSSTELSSATNRHVTSTQLVDTQPVRPNNRRLF